LEVLGVKSERIKRYRPARKFASKLMPNEIGTRKRTYYMCARKKRYRSQAEAHSMANVAFQQRGTRLHCYFCSLCGGYHLTKRTRVNNINNSGRVF